MSDKIRKLRKKPIEVEAIQFFDDTETIVAISDFIGGEVRVDYADPSKPLLKFAGLHSKELHIEEGDWVLKGTLPGDYYPLKSGETFEATYELVP